MNKLIANDFLQDCINPFLGDDKTLVTWKLTCKSNFIYRHMIWLSSVPFDKVVNGNFGTLVIVSITLDEYINFDCDILHKFPLCTKYVTELNLRNSPYYFGEYNMVRFPSLVTLIIDFKENISDKVLNNFALLQFLEVGGPFVISPSLFMYITKIQTIIMPNYISEDVDQLYFIPNIIELEYDTSFGEHNSIITGGIIHKHIKYEHGTKLNIGNLNDERKKGSRIAFDYACSIVKNLAYYPYNHYVYEPDRYSEAYYYDDEDYMRSKKWEQKRREKHRVMDTLIVVAISSYVISTF